MNLLKGLLPIIEKKDSSRPITFKNRASIQALLNEEARLERIATKTVNNDPNRLLLEPVSHTLFDVFDYGTEKDSVIDSSPQDILKLVPLGGLSVTHDPDPIDPNRVLPQLDIKAYQERRKAALQIQAPDQSPNGTISIDGDTDMVDITEEEYLPNTQDVNNMIESILGPDSAMKEVASTSIETEAALSQPEASLDQLEAVATQPIVPAHPEIQNQPIVSAHPEAQNQPIVPAHPEAQNQPIVPAHSEVQNHETVPQSAVSKQTQATMAPMDTTERAESRWYADDTITRTEITISEAEKIYAYEKQMIPMFATLSQQDQCEKITRTFQATTTNMFNMNFDKPISVLNFSSSLDLSLEEQWNQSGKVMFLKSLLGGLLGKDLIVLIVANDLGEEETLVTLIGEYLQLDCVRVNYLLDEDWNGEYGVLVKTMLKVDQQKGSAQRGNNFSRSADFIVCMDVRTSRDNVLFDKITKRSTCDSQPPIAWLVTLGSVEERVFNHLEKSDTQYSDSKSVAFKGLLRVADDWPNDEKLSTEELNIIVAENVKSWLMSSGKDISSYQYRSTVCLPKAFHFASIKPAVIRQVEHTTTVMPIVEDQTASDMDIGSDSEEAVEPLPELSQKLTKYISNVLFPPFDTKKGHLSKPNLSSVPILSAEDQERLRSLPMNLYSEYCAQINILKRKHQLEYEELHYKFQKNAISILNTPE